MISWDIPSILTPNLTQSPRKIRLISAMVTLIWYLNGFIISWPPLIFMFIGPFLSTVGLIFRGLMTGATDCVPTVMSIILHLIGHSVCPTLCSPSWILLNDISACTWLRMCFYQRQICCSCCGFYHLTLFRYDNVTDVRVQESCCYYLQWLELYMTFYFQFGVGWVHLDWFMMIYDLFDVRRGYVCCRWVIKMRLWIDVHYKSFHVSPPLCI